MANFVLTVQGRTVSLLITDVVPASSKWFPFLASF